MLAYKPLIFNISFEQNDCMPVGWCFYNAGGSPGVQRKAGAVLHVLIEELRNNGSRREDNDL